jgi:hypothetical protein
MTHVDCTDFLTEIDAPVDQVFSTMSNVTAWPSWTRAITSSWGVSPGSLREGYEFVMQTMVAPPVPLRLTVLEFEANRRIAWGMKKPGMTVLHRIEFEPKGPVHCVVRNHEFVEGILARPAGRLLAAPIDRLDRQWAHDLAARFRHN